MQFNQVQRPVRLLLDACTVGGELLHELQRIEGRAWWHRLHLRPAQVSKVAKFPRQVSSF